VSHLGGGWVDEAELKHDGVIDVSGGVRMSYGGVGFKSLECSWCFVLKQNNTEGISDRINWTLAPV
jgi:hypothetical protein